MRLHVLLSLASLLPSAFAVFADDAYHVDYHHALLGLPQEHTTFFQQPYAGSKAALIYTLSDKLVLGAVNPKDGHIVWRQSLASSNATKSWLRAGEGQDIVVAAVGSQVTAWSAADGRLVWSAESLSGPVQDLEIIEIEDSEVSAGPKDVLVLFNGSTPVVSRLDGKTGQVKWSFEDERYELLHSPLHVTYNSQPFQWRRTSSSTSLRSRHPLHLPAHHASWRTEDQSGVSGPVDRTQNRPIQPEL